MKILTNFELPLWLNCSQINIKVVIFIKYGWITIVWAQIINLRHFVLKIYQVSKAISAAKSRNFVGNLGSQKPTWTRCLEFNFFFFLSEKTRLQILEGKNSSWAHIIFTHKSYNETVDKIIKQPKKQGKNKTLFVQPNLTFASDRLFIFLGFLELHRMVQGN